MKKDETDIFNKLLFGFGIALGSVVLFVLIAGVVIALFSLLLDRRVRPARIRAVQTANGGGEALPGERNPLLAGGEPNGRKK